MPDKPTEVVLMVNRDNMTSTKFDRVRTPFLLSQNTYRILDSSDGYATRFNALLQRDVFQLEFRQQFKPFPHVFPNLAASEIRSAFLQVKALGGDAKDAVDVYSSDSSGVDFVISLYNVARRRHTTEFEKVFALEVCQDG